MILTIAAFVVAVLALGVVIYLIARHWKEIRLLDPLSIREEQHRQQRQALIMQRFDRLRAEKFQPAKLLARRLKRSISAAYQRTFERLQALENMYQNVKSPLAAMAPSARENIKTLMAEGRSLMRDLKWADAERKFIEVLSLDKKQADAYKGLGQIYLKQKLYPQAKETFDFVVRLKKADDVVYAALAEIAEADHDPARAETMRLKAVEAGPRQAFRHAELAEYYLGRSAFAKAWPSAKRASDLEPKSAKYLELSLEVVLGLQEAPEARRRYNRLRLLVEDNAKVQHWREKVEALEAENEGQKAGSKKEKGI